MAAARVERSSEQFLCSICLEVFIDPVSTPCGHNFCKTCLTLAWDTSAPCRCPLCNKTFDTRPELSVNTFVKEMVSQFSLDTNCDTLEDLLDLSEVSNAKVPCDMCTDPRLKAVKSCLVCLVSDCDTHLQPHLTVSVLKRHQLIKPVQNLQHRMCPKHHRPLELFCRSDNSCICTMCPLLEHKYHRIVSLKEGSDMVRASLLEIHARTPHLVEQRRLKIQQVRHSLELSQNAVGRERTMGLQVFTALMQRKYQFIEELKEKHRQIQKQAQDLIQELDQEISKLEKRSSEVEQLSRSEDHLHILQRSTSLSPAADLKDWSMISFEPHTFAPTALSELEDSLTEEIHKVFQAELKRVQQFAVDITLDPDTAHPDLLVSKDLKQVHHTDATQSLPYRPRRFSKCVCILGQQGFSSDRFYFEVHVKGKTEWDLGVAQGSIKRKGLITASPKNRYWIISLRNRTQLKACTDSPVPLFLKCSPEKVGVFVDYEEGVVSFYDVDTAHHIYSFTGCCFKDKLFPFFSPCFNDEGKNSAPLTITKI